MLFWSLGISFLRDHSAWGLECLRGGPWSEGLVFRGSGSWLFGTEGWQGFGLGNLRGEVLSLRDPQFCREWPWCYP